MLDSLCIKPSGDNKVFPFDNVLASCCWEFKNHLGDGWWHDEDTTKRKEFEALKGLG